MDQTVVKGYDAEMRFGVVMYGGVSLAIYIYGVSQELFELACATPGEGAAAPADADPGGGTRELYRRLSLLASDPALRERYAAALDLRGSGPNADADVWPGAAAGAEGTRFVIDVIAGTSAGGINGIFLAKALTQAQAFSSLGKLWVEEGDIGALLNDAQAARGLPALKGRNGVPQSLLSSDRMYLKLLQAFGEMAPLPGGADGRPVAPLVDELDLFVTTTDIQGAPVALRLFDKVVYERRHRQRFHFSHPTQQPGQPAGFDFAAANHPFLAFAARCTSSFPFAFEPMTIGRMRELSPQVGDAQLQQWQAYFDALAPLGLAQRPFGDGGYLDNKPFSYVADTLSRRFGDAPAQRKLIYIEPDPEPLTPGDDALPTPPNAVENALAALLGIPQYETVREDLNAVLKRNRRIDRVERIVRLAEQDIERAGGSFARVVVTGPQVRRWADLTMDDMVAYYGRGFVPYRRLRMYATTDWLAEQVAAAFGVDAESDRGYALRAVVRTWRERQYADNPAPGSRKRPVNTFLQEHDIDYRLRRMAFVLRRIDLLTRLLARPPAELSELEALVAQKMARRFGPALDPQLNAVLRPLVLARLRELKQQLRGVYRGVVAIRRGWANGDGVRAGLAIEDGVRPAIFIDDLLRGELDGVLAMLLGQTPAAGQPLPQVRNEKQQLVDLPTDLPWLQAGSAGYSLQDSVMHRVQEWLRRAEGQPALLLWDALYRAINATRLDAGGPQGQAVDALFKRSWDLLGQPHLESRVVQKLVPPGTPLPTYEAELAVTVDPDAPPGDAGEALHRLRLLLGDYYLNFDSFDQMRFTLYYDTGTGEPSTVDVVRVSPVDATALRPWRRGDSKLAGNSLAHFGAFLDEAWRHNDIMWGRLDGAERLIQTVLPDDGAPATARVRQELIRLAHERILVQTLQRRASAELMQWLVSALHQAGGATAGDRLQRLLDQLQVAPGKARDRLAGALAGLLDTDRLRAFAATEPTFDKHPPMEPTMRNAARAVTVTGRLLQGISQAEAATAEPLARWAARLGLVLQGAMVVAVPGTLGQRVFGHLLPLVYAVELLLLAVGLLFGESGLRFAALSALGATVLVHLLTLLLRDVARGGHQGRVLLGVLVALALLLPAGFGVLAYSQQRAGAVCGPPAAAAGLPGWLRAPCGWLR